jgi:hypothetical protein
VHLQGIIFSLCYHGLGGQLLHAFALHISLIRYRIRISFDELA